MNGNIESRVSKTTGRRTYRVRVYVGKREAEPRPTGVISG